MDGCNSFFVSNRPCLWEHQAHTWLVYGCWLRRLPTQRESLVYKLIHGLRASSCGQTTYTPWISCCKPKFSYYADLLIEYDITCGSCRYCDSKQVFCVTQQSYVGFTLAEWKVVFQSWHHVFADGLPCGFWFILGDRFVMLIALAFSCLMFLGRIFMPCMSCVSWLCVDVILRLTLYSWQQGCNLQICCRFHMPEFWMYYVNVLPEMMCTCSLLNIFAYLLASAPWFLNSLAVFRFNARLLIDTIIWFKDREIISSSFLIPLLDDHWLVDTLYCCWVWITQQVTMINWDCFTI